MVDLMSLLSDALIGSFQMLMLNDFGKNMFPYRIKTCWKRILIYGVTALVILGVNHIESTFVNIMMVPVCYTIASIVIFQGSVWKKIILACCYYMLAIVPEFLFAVITGAYGVTGTENNFHSELEKLLSLLLMSTITFLLVKCFNQITRKKNYQTIENKLFTVLLTLPAATIIIFMCIYYSQISFTGVNRIMIPIGAALLLMTNICIFAVFDKLIEKSEEVKKMELLYQKSKAENINQKYMADYKTNLNYKSSGWFFLCNLYKNGKTRKRCKRMNDSAFLNSRRTGIFKDMSNGTICIPKDLRDNNGLEKNDRVELIPMQEGIYIRKAYGEKKCQ